MEWIISSRDKILLSTLALEKPVSQKSYTDFRFTDKYFKIIRKSLCSIKKTKNVV